jgi:hypothetical protein
MQYFIRKKEACQALPKYRQIAGWNYYLIYIQHVMPYRMSATNADYRQENSTGQWLSMACQIVQSVGSQRSN